jgi:hypothetical protein
MAVQGSIKTANIFTIYVTTLKIFLFVASGISLQQAMVNLHVME